MRQEREPFRQQFSSSNRGVDTNPPRTNPPRRWNPIDTSGEMGLLQRHSGETHSAGRLQDQERWRFWTRRAPDGDPSSQNDEERIENNGEGKEEEDSRKSDSFEPFLNPEPQEENLFVNNYGGNFSQQMELNRGGVERALKIAHLDGKVFLTNLQPNRSRAEAQGNELAAKRFLIFGEKTQKAEEENPYKRVVPVLEGWRIEINDQRITEELTEKKLSGEKLQRAFINTFNSQLKDALRECVWREKCSSEKDRDFTRKLFLSLGTVGACVTFDVPSLIFGSPLLYTSFAIGHPFMAFGIAHLLATQIRRRHEDLRERLKENIPSFRPMSPHRNIDHAWEYFMPYVEIDKVARAFAYLSGKGRKLVREAK